MGIFQWPATPWHTQYDTIDNLNAQELARCAWATTSASYLVANAGPREALAWMHDVRAATSRRLAAVVARGRAAILAGGQLDVADELRYSAERDAAAIASCLDVCHGSSSRDALAATVDKLRASLTTDREASVAALDDFARLARRMDPHA